MAGIPLFTTQVGTDVKPWNIPVEPLNPTRQYAMGAATAKDVPSPALAVAQGIQGAVETYDKNTQIEEANRSRQLLNQSAAIDLANKQQLNPAQLEAEQLKIQAEKDKYAEEIRLNQKKQELFRILQGDDPKAKGDAIRNGQFVDILSKDPKLEETAIAIARSTGDFSDEEAQVFFHGKARSDQNSLRERTGTANQAKYEGVATALDGSILAGKFRIKGYDPDFTIEDLTNLVPYPAGQLTIDPNTHKAAKDVNGGLLISDALPSADIAGQTDWLNPRTGTTVRLDKTGSTDHIKLLNSFNTSKGAYAGGGGYERTTPADKRSIYENYASSRGGQPVQPQAGQATGAQQQQAQQPAPPPAGTQPTPPPTPVSPLSSVAKDYSQGISTDTAARPPQIRDLKTLVNSTGKGPIVDKEQAEIQIPTVLIGSEAAKTFIDNPDNKRLLNTLLDTAYYKPHLTLFDDERSKQHAAAREDYLRNLITAEYYEKIKDPVQRQALEEARAEYQVRYDNRYTVGSTRDLPEAGTLFGPSNGPLGIEDVEIANLDPIAGLFGKKQPVASTAEYYYLTRLPAMRQRWQAIGNAIRDEVEEGKKARARQELSASRGAKAVSSPQPVGKASADNGLEALRRQ